MTPTPPPSLVVRGDFIYLRDDLRGAPVFDLGTITKGMEGRYLRPGADMAHAPAVPGYRAFLALSPVTP